MLKRLHIENIAIIDRADITFENGMTVITGETGSGKSLILDAIAIVFGAKVSAKEIVRQGQEKAVIELWVELNARQAEKELFQRILGTAELELNDELELLISREFTGKGSRSRINGIPVAREIVEQIRPFILDLHGQHELTSLFECDSQRDFLDALGDLKCQTLKKEVTETYQRYLQIKTKIDEIKNNQQQWLQQKDFLTFQCQELEEAQLSDPQEDVLLQEKRQRLTHLDRIERNTAEAAFWCGSDSTVIEGLEKIQALLGGIDGFDPALLPISEAFDCIYEQVRQLSNDLTRYHSSLDMDPEQLDSIVSRLDTLERLKRKYGPTLPDVFSTYEVLHCKLQNLINFESDIDTLLATLDHLETTLTNVSLELTEARKILAKRLEKGLLQELKILSLPAVRFEVSFEQTVFSANGKDHITFMFSANPGEPLRPLAKVASGGELSRVLLGLKVVTAAKEGTPTLIFDEIDTGISGSTAKSMAKKLKTLSKDVQVLAITHQPVIAAIADHHWHVEKKLKSKSVLVRIESLQMETERLKILSRMIDGTDKALDMAAKLRSHSL